jgi:hypothetical protein
LKKLIVCEAELKALSARHATVSLHTRVTREQGRFKADDLKVLAIELPKSDWLICGSKAFQFEAQKLLLEQGIGAQNIHVESFDAVGGSMPSAAKEVTMRPTVGRTVTGYLLLVGVTAFILQAGLDFKFSLLQSWQAKTFYSVLTAAIVALLVYQWQLGYLRLRGRIAEASRDYGVHIAIGPAIIFAMWFRICAQHGTEDHHARESFDRRGPRSARAVTALGRRAARAAGHSHPPYMPCLSARECRSHARRRHEVRDFAGVSDQRLRRIAVPLIAPAFAGPPMPDG